MNAIGSESTDRIRGTLGSDLTYEDIVSALNEAMSGRNPWPHSRWLSILSALLDDLDRRDVPIPSSLAAHGPDGHETGGDHRQYVQAAVQGAIEVDQIMAEAWSEDLSVEVARSRVDDAAAELFRLVAYLPSRVRGVVTNDEALKSSAGNSPSLGAPNRSRLTGSKPPPAVFENRDSNADWAIFVGGWAAFSVIAAGYGLHVVTKRKHVRENLHNARTNG